MKKVLFALSAALVLFSACQEKEGPAVEFVLTDQMIEVGVEGEYNVVVDASTKTVVIEVAYAEKDALAALPVNFVNLPEGVAVENAQLNLADGATATVTFTKESTDFIYTFSATYAQPDPQFTGLTLVLKGEAEDGSQDVRADVAGGVAKFKSGTDLSELVVEYTVAPEGTVVSVGETVVVSGTTALDFSDKANGVNFNLSIEGVINTVNVKAMTTGISTISRVWAKYTSAYDGGEWFSNLIKDDGAKDAGWERNIALDDKYLYLVKAGKGVYAYNIADGSFAAELNVEGLDKNAAGEAVSAQWFTIDAEVVKSNGENILLVAGGALSPSHTLQVFKYTSIDAAPELVLSYPIPATGIRLGDKFHVEGDWSEGKLMFVNYSARNVYFFTINNGVVNPTPVVVELPIGVTGNSIGTLTAYSDTEYLWSGLGGGNNKPQVLNYANNAFELSYAVPTTGDSYYGGQNHDPYFFTFNEQNYMAVTRRTGDNMLVTLRIFELNGNTLAESIENPGKINELSIAHPTDTKFNGVKDGNGLGACAVYQTADGKTYIAASGLGCGVSLFELK